MNGNISENNVVTIAGKVVSELKQSHEVYGEVFYNVYISVKRLSDSNDILPVLVSERLLTGRTLEPGVFVEIDGQFRSYNNLNSEGSKLILTVFAKNVKFIEENEVRNPNQIYLNGFICKKPVYRTTPFGREISDILLAVNRLYNKSDYIPCIAWGRNARYADSFQVGENVKIWGRIQSREYQKKLETGEVITKVAYEVSVSKLELIKRTPDSEQPHFEEDRSKCESINITGDNNVNDMLIKQ